MERRIYRLLGLVFMAFLWTGCEDLYGEYGNFTPSAFMRYLRPSETSFEYESSSAHKVHFMVESMDTEWEFSNSSNWFTLSPNKGNTTTEISMSIQENPSGESSRIGLFELHSLEADWMYSKTLKVSQFAATPYLIIKDNYFTFSGGSGEEEIDISTNCSWTANSYNSWIQLEKGKEGNSLIIKVTPNPGKSSREGTISISCKSNYTTVYIYQYPSQITSSDAYLSFENTASTLSVSITSAADWKVSTNRSWLSVSPSSGIAGKHDINILVSPNNSISSRKGVVSFYTGDAVKAQIEVEQKGLYIDTKEESLQFTSKEDKQSLEILSNTDWQITSYPEWLKFSEFSGHGTKTIEVTSIDNPSVNSRNGKVVITQEGMNLSQEIVVYQAGKTFEVDSYMEFPHYASSQTIQLQSELPWTSYILSPDWISTNQQSGNTDAEIIVSVIENNSYDERTGSIKYMVEGMSKKIIVNQQAKYFTINDKVFSFTSKGGEVDISFGTNEKWTAIIEDNLDWLSLSATSGEGDGNITLSVGDNLSVNSRSAMVIINTGTGQSYRIPITQAARYLKVDTQSLMFFMEGGTSNIIHVNTDGEYELIPSAEWIKINKLSESDFTISTPLYNEENSRQGTILIKMKDLIDGEMSITIPIIQNGRRLVFKIVDYSTDVDWNPVNKKGFDLIIQKYIDDVNWNTNSSNKFLVNKVIYQSDNNWNEVTEKKDSIVMEKYKDDINMNQLIENHKDIDMVDYEYDKNWNN